MDKLTKDKFLCYAIVHEARRAVDAYLEFDSAVRDMADKGHSAMGAYNAYNAYSYFILHLYEFCMACFDREVLTGQLRVDERIWKNARSRSGVTDDLLCSAAWNAVNFVAGFPGELSPRILSDLKRIKSIRDIADFGEAFRRTRNHVAGHATYKRVLEHDLSAFFSRYHLLLVCLLSHNSGFWQATSEEIDTIPTVTDFLEAALVRPGGDEVIEMLGLKG